MTHEEAIKLIDELGICGCGIPDRTYEAVYEMLFKAKGGGDICPTNDPYVYFMAYRLTEMELMEHGGAVGYSWLTPKGKKMLEALECLKKHDFELSLMEGGDEE